MVIFDPNFFLMVFTCSSPVEVSYVIFVVEFGRFFDFFWLPSNSLLVYVWEYFLSGFLTFLDYCWAKFYFEVVFEFVFGRGFLCGFCWAIWTFF